MNDFISELEKISKYQFENKIVMSYTGLPRAQYFSKNDKVGVSCGFFWLTENTSIQILLNSKLFLKIALSITDPEIHMWKPYGFPPLLPIWLLRSLNFDGLEATNDQELYEHYGLTEEEIDYIEN